MTTGVDTRMFTAIGLAPRTSYTFEVEVFNINEMLVGPPASIAVVTSVPESELIYSLNDFTSQFWLHHRCWFSSQWCTLW